MKKKLQRWQRCGSAKLLGLLQAWRLNEAARIMSNGYPYERACLRPRKGRVWSAEDCFPRPIRAEVLRPSI
jgi:hypothetical protein